MIPLMFAAALVDTVALPDDWNSVIIHEWGVLTISEGLLVESVPWQYGNPHFINDPSMDDRAPVVYFYGSDFHDAEFTVELSSGTFTEMFPAPDAVSSDNLSITWNILNAQNLRGYEIPAPRLPEAPALSGWAMEGWRDSYSHVLDFGNETQDRFIFYECSIPFNEREPLFPFSAAGGLDVSYEGQVLVFAQSFEQPGSTNMMLCNADGIAASSLGMEPYTYDSAFEILCSWSNGDLKPEELHDLWDTWEDYVIGGEWDSDRLLVFRIPASSIDEITTLNLTTAESCDIVINRFYLGMVPFNWTF